MIGSQTPMRTKLEKDLASFDWNCHVANSIEEAQNTHSWQELRVLMISYEELVSKKALTRMICLSNFAQIVAYTESDTFEAYQSVDTSDLFSIVSLPQTPAWQLDLILRRAVEKADLTLGQSPPAIESVYRRLFEASAELLDSETLSQLLERTCREIVLGAGFQRAMLVLGDSKFRIQNAQAFFAPSQKVIDMSALIGQPLLPVLPTRPFTKVGKGFEFQNLVVDQTKDQSDRNFVFTIERPDQTIIGYLTLDSPTAENVDLSAISEPIAILLKLTVAFMETHALRAQLKQRAENSDPLSSEKTAELRQAQERFSRLVNLMNDIVYLTDAQGRIVYLNEVFCDRLGYTRENFVGQMLDSVLADISAVSESNTLAISEIRTREHDRVNQEIEIFTKAGYRKVFSVSHQWVRQAEDIVAGQGVLHDISELREIQTQFARSERSGLVGKLASGVAHEINNPLQAILSHLAGIGESVADNAKAMEGLGIISDSVERIRIMVRGLMDLQRTDLSVRTIENVNSIIERTIALLGPQLRDSGIGVALELDQHLSLCRVDSGEIEQVLINVILNAMDAMPLGGNLNVKSESTTGEITVKVTDTGRGIAPHIMGSLFQPFSSHREKGGGLGMGLYMSRGIMHQHGGDLQAESPPGEGATLILVLPTVT